MSRARSHNRFNPILISYENDAIRSEENAQQLIQILRENDETKIQNCNSDIDTLLVFAGLFSAVIAAFIIESYKTLQQDPTDRSVQILAQISQQLNGLAFNGATGSITPSQSIPPLPDFVTPSTAVGINVLWFVALVFSLISASLGIFVKQWLREYLQFGCTAPEEQIRIRLARYRGLQRWKVFEIAGVLPFLLQVSLVLFFIGLSEFLRPLNRIVWTITTVIVVIWLALYAFFICTPAISSKCPYKTSILTPTANVIRGLFNRAWYGNHWRLAIGSLPSYYRFPGDERAIRRDQRFDKEALIEADEVLQDDTILLNILGHSIIRTKPQDMVSICHNILSHRLDREVVSLCQPLDYSLIHSRALRSVVDTLANALNTAKWPTRDRDKAWKEEAFVGLCAIFHNVLSRDRFVGIGDGLKAIFLALSEEHDERRGEMFLRVLLLEPPEDESYRDITYFEPEKAFTLINGLMKTATSILMESDRHPILPPVYGTESSKERESGEKGALEALLVILTLLSRRTDSDENLTPHSEGFSEFMQSWRTYVDQHEVPQYRPRSRKSNRRKELLQRIGDCIRAINQDIEDFITPDIIEFLGEQFGLDKNRTTVYRRNYSPGYTRDDHPFIPPLLPPLMDYLPDAELSYPNHDHNPAYPSISAAGLQSPILYPPGGYSACPQNYIILPRNILNRGSDVEDNYDEGIHEHMVAYPVMMVSDLSRFRGNEYTGLEGTVRANHDPPITGAVEERNRHEPTPLTKYLPPRRNTL